MKKKIKSLFCIVLSVLTVMLSLSGCFGGTVEKSVIGELFKDMSKISYATSYKELKANKTNSEKSWRQGMVSGNGMQGFITSGSPYEDTFIFQNMHFIMPNVNVRYCPVVSDELEEVKQHIVNGEDIVDNASYDDVYRFHPGGQLRLSLEGKGEKNYARFTDYATSEVGVYFENGDGVWKRTSFTSMSDGVAITKLSQSDSGAKLNLTLSFDDLSAIAKFGKSDEANMKYKKLVDDNADVMSLVAHYPDYENSELKYGGYATVTYVICEGGSKEKCDLKKNIEESQYSSNENPGIKITDADNVYLITVTGRTYDMGGLNSFDESFEFVLVDELSQKVMSVGEKYTDEGFNYDRALEEHLKLYEPQFNAVTLDLGTQSDASNEELIKAQKNKKELNSDLLERAYYQGRFAYVCCAGYATSRLYGMWTGEFDTGWGSKYTMDANVNLQTSSMNTSNISSAPIGYTYFILRQLPDWEENAFATHGFTNAIQAPVNTDGDKAVITETCYPYPFRYWNAGTSWMIQPLYETLMCYGNIQIPLSDEFDLNKLRSVLSTTSEPLTDEQISAITERGYLMLEEDVLLPLLVKSANYWTQLMTPEYYTDSQGNIYYEQGKTELAEGEYYCIVPSYSPENNPANYPSPSTANCAIDISACRDNIDMLIDVMSDVQPDADTSQWQEFKEKIPPYLYDDTGALKEWATSEMEENNEHRHLSHLYCVWPLFETQKNQELTDACEQAIANRESENESSHALVHRALIAARLKDRASTTEALASLMNHKIYYNSLMTNHNYDRSSCYCTDFAIGYLGIINESLIYSNKGEIELLPSLLESGCNQGEITGIRTRTQATVDSLKWDISAKTCTAVITSDIHQTIVISSPLSQDTQTVELEAGQSVTVDLALD